MFDVLVQTRRYDGALRVVQALLHHSTLATTEEYIGLTTEALTRDDFLRTAVLLDGPDQQPGRAAGHGLPPIVGSAPDAGGTG